MQTCLHSNSCMEKALSLLVSGHDISHNGRFLRRFLEISAEIAYNTSKAESTSVLVVFSRRPLCLMMMPIYTGSITVSSLIPLASCSPISVVRLDADVLGKRRQTEARPLGNTARFTHTPGLKPRNWKIRSEPMITRFGSLLLAM